MTQTKANLINEINEQIEEFELSGAIWLNDIKSFLQLAPLLKTKKQKYQKVLYNIKLIKKKFNKLL